MELVVVAFLDANFVRRSAAHVLGVDADRVELDAAAVVRWFREDWRFFASAGVPTRAQRIYWYDGALEPADPDYETQRDRLQAVARTPGVQLRLGRARRRKGQLHQKGVDTLIVLDLVRLAQTRAFDRGVLLAGDEDLAEAVRVAQDFGPSIALTVPDMGRVAGAMLEVVDSALAWGPFVQQLVRVDGEGPDPAAPLVLPKVPPPPGTARRP